MEDIKPVGFVVLINRGDDWIDDGFDGAVGQRVNERGDVEGEKVGGENSQQGRSKMADEREYHGSSIADAIDDQAEQNNRNGERIEADAADDSLLLFG